MLDLKLIYGFTCTDSIRKSDAAFNQSATVRPYELKHNYLVKRTLNL